MKEIKIIIEKTKDMYTAYADNAEGIYGGGDTIEEAKASIETSIKLYNIYNKLIIGFLHINKYLIVMTIIWNIINLKPIFYKINLNNTLLI